MRIEIPVDPGAEEARRWLIDELAKPEYRAAEPSWFDRLMQRIGEWLGELFSGAGGVPQPFVIGIVVLIVVVLVVIGLLVFGVPRLRRRRAAQVPLFEDGDVRGLDELRRAAALAAQRGDWPLAIEERFRALARGLTERELVRVHPGTTAHAIAAAATTPFPEHAAGLQQAARAFDEVRYLGRSGGAAEYEQLTALETVIATTPPVDTVAHGPAVPV
ncbi:DUF4129 domain-containing protein [Agromyces sp. NBRC 114283]|nr:DUF4129 domain-containing protein [Agromyces sp. NBRC 114283]GLU90606.1 hypothetical protein Agsp01_28610 [Agromyces sp. NBRC 114283]